ncbi:MAG: c-type cytochrome, partial [Planctomycetales bacterium]|nr:c-type cytochrome [Planctomycetales bacterium]
IVILEDSDGDGRHDQRTVFYEGLNYVTGIEVGFGGAWVMSPPNFYFIPDRDGNDVPDSAPQLLLDGFGNHANAHNLANGFAWGPDGWLYGTHGRTNWSMIGKPGTPEAERTRFDGGVYRYHPLRQVWEPYADGTTNPWGIDWNDYGHAFVCNCVNPHLFQVIQGAHYEPWRARESSQFAYQRIDTIADHLHFVGLRNVRGGLGSAEEDAAGGGHAHCGTMIYLGDSLPDSYRNTLFTNNIHGRRINNDRPRRSGSGYVASHGPDLLRSRDPWFMGVTLAYGPGGEIYVSDWSDTGECHSTRNTRRETGRIYRLTYGRHQLPLVNLATYTAEQLTELQLHRNDWYVRHARRRLQERFAAGEDMTAVHRRLREQFATEPEVPQKLRALWALHVTEGLDEEFLLEALHHASEDIRSWAVTLLCESPPPSLQVRQRFVELARHGSSPLVRLSLASALQRLAPGDRWDLAVALASRQEDASDQNLPLMIWYGCIPLVDQDLQRFARLGAEAAIGRVRINIARRIASCDRAEQGLEFLAGHLAGQGDAAEPDKVLSDAAAGDLLEGMLLGVEGRRSLALPRSWPAAYARLSVRPDAALRDKLVRMALVFNDPTALAILRQQALDGQLAAADRQRAIEALVSKRQPGFDGDLLRLLDEDSARAAAIQGLATYNHPQTAAAILARYDTLDSSQQQVALLTLASRTAWSRALLDAIEQQRVPVGDLTAFTARQIRSLGDEHIDRRLANLWGEIRDTPQDRRKQIDALKQWLTPEVMQQADVEHGAAVFQKQCATCHQFFGQGGKIGPDLTGAQRTNLDYLLENIVDPSATVAHDYQMEIVQTEDGRVITGLIESENSQSLAIQTVSERLVLAQSEIAG